VTIRNSLLNFRIKSQFSNDLLVHLLSGLFEKGMLLFY